MASSSSTIFSNRSLLLGLLVIFLLTPLSLSRKTPSLPPIPILESHGGPLINGTLNLSLLWYGRFTPSQKDRIRDFIDSLNYDAKEGLDPKVSSWWRVVESYQHVGKSDGMPKIQVKVVASYVDESMQYGEELKGQNISKLVETAAGEKSGVVPVIFTSRQVKVEGFCNRTCQQHALFGEQPYILVSNPELQCPGACAWPFHRAKEGPSGMTYQPPSGDLGADAMIIQLATALADYATNPTLTGFYCRSEDHGHRHGDGDDFSDVVEAATACTGVFGSGAFPGFTGRIRVDPATGGAFNSHGVKHIKFLVPAVWNPKTSSCWTPM